MKLTTHLLCGVLIAFGLLSAAGALAGVDLLFLLAFRNAYVYRAMLSLAGVAALWLLFWLIAFRPTKFLS